MVANRSVFTPVKIQLIITYMCMYVTKCTHAHARLHAHAPTLSILARVHARTLTHACTLIVCTCTLHSARVSFRGGGGGEPHSPPPPWLPLELTLSSAVHVKRATCISPPNYVLLFCPPPSAQVLKETLYAHSRVMSSPHTCT